MPAWIVLGVWIGTQFAAAPTNFSQEGGVAYFAHIGGFLAGASLIPFFKRKDIPLFGKYETVMSKSDFTNPISFDEIKKQAIKKYTYQKFEASCQKEPRASKYFVHQSNLAEKNLALGP